MLKKSISRESIEDVKGKTPDQSTVVVKKIPKPAGTGEKRYAMPGQDIPDVKKKVETKGGSYPVYKKDSTNASEFRSAFSAARKAGKSSFSFAGRKYSTKVK